jgi:hypothetical protein
MERSMKMQLLICALLLGSTASAEEVIVKEKPKKDRGEIMLALKIGASFPGVFNRLQTSYLIDLEVGYALPFLKHRLALSIDAGFTAPEANGSSTDPRLDAAGGMYSWHLEQRELSFGITLYYRHPIGKFIPYVGVGPRLFLLESKVRGYAGGANISTSTEDSSKIGAGIPVGFGYTLGPGHLLVELALAIGPIDHTTTGNDLVGALSLAVGYRLMF